MDGRFGFEPRVLVGIYRGIHFRGQTFANPFAVVHQNLAQFLDAKALHEVVGALQVLGILPVVLHEQAHVFQHLVVGVHGA